MQNSKLFRKLLAVSLGLALASGCVVSERGYVGGEVEVTGAPPVDVVETVAPSPGVDFLWVPGFHAWGGGRWGWTPGHWERPPRPGVSWHAPHYENRSGRHYWSRGHWG